MLCAPLVPEWQEAVNKLVSRTGDALPHRLTVENVLGTGIADDDFQQCLTMFETSMRAMYERTWGYNRERRTRELRHTNSLYLLVRDDATQRIVAFVNHRFVMIPASLVVLYVYEIQVAAELRRFGVGRFLMKVRAAQRGGGAWHTNRAHASARSAWRTSRASTTSRASA